MKTDDLVTLLARGPIAVPRHAVARRYALALVAGVTMTGALLLATLGLNPDLHAAMMLPNFWLKVLFAATLGLAGGVATSRLARPGAGLARLPALFATPIVLMWLLGAVVWLRAEGGERDSLLFGTTWQVCPFLIAGLSLPLFATFTWALRGLAPTRLRLAGLAVGFLSGALAALIYCLHCPEMGPPFVACWYLLGMLIPTVVGGVLGPRLLRW